MIVVNGETYNFEVIKRVKNSAYESQDNISISFKGRPANNLEKKLYRIQKGVEGGSDSTYVIASNLPEDLSIGDTIIFLNRRGTVTSVGYYFDNNRIVNAGIFNEEYLIARCPKGITIE